MVEEGRTENRAGPHPTTDPAEILKAVLGLIDEEWSWLGREHDAAEARKFIRACLRLARKKGRREAAEYGRRNV